MKATRMIKRTKQIILTCSQFEAQVIEYASFLHFRSSTDLGGIFGILSLISVFVMLSLWKSSNLPTSMRILK